MIGFMEAPLTVRERLRLLELAESAHNYEVRQHALALLKAEEKPPMTIGILYFPYPSGTVRDG